MTPAGVRTCPNCGRDRPESFCAHCGQSDRDYTRALRSVAGEFVRETFEVDSRLFRTLKLLMFRPGSLTREFSRNRRAGFVSPVRLYIFASFVFFLLLSLLGNVGEAVEQSMAEEDRTIAADAAEENQADAGAEDEADAAQPPTEEQLAAFRAALSPEQRRQADDILGRSDDNIATQAIFAAARAGNFEERHWMERFLVLAAIDIGHDPSVIPQRFLANMPIAMFCLLPVLGLILAIFHFRKKRFYVEHLVFAIHVQTFTFLIYAVALLLPESGPGLWVRVGCLLVPYPYFVIALRRYYDNGWVLSVAKSVGVYVLYSMALIPASILSILVTG
ncbi:MAG: DUF3667 domain-containing protein [Gemmatimonadetes bacterium]|nr:DUF3667 domain-containing protein [Candidatus Palauibacter rhopaloidicola]